MIELIGDLGAGKTTFVQGIARGLGVKGMVPSPTFTFSRVYPLENGMSLHHFDLYRLDSWDMVSEALQEVTEDERAIVITEWSQNGAGKLPEGRVVVELLPSDDVEDRSITITVPDELTYVLKGLPR